MISVVQGAPGTTPGPWNINQPDEEGFWEIGTGAWHGDAYEDLQIATAHGYYGAAEADAHQIAASPLMYAALEAGEHDLVGKYTAIAQGNAESGARFADNDPVVLQIRAAMRAARGEVA